MNAAPLQGLVLSDNAPPHFTPLRNVSLVVLVGVTGVGKSTALMALQNAGLHVLPDRRIVTDGAIIEPLAGRAITDREERFALTAQYRARHPGGMAHALGTLALDPALATGQLVFDGLRGLDEVRHASEQYPAWRFVNLNAPDLVRVRRLLGRADAFDQVQASTDGEGLHAQLWALKGVDGVFSDVELTAIAALPQEGFAPADVLAKARIVVSERRQYDPAAASAYLQTLPRERALIIDTVRRSPEQVAQEVRAWL